MGGVIFKPMDCFLDSDLDGCGEWIGGGFDIGIEGILSF